MAIFTDTFDRANGAPGGNWANIMSTVSIAGYSLVGTGNSSAYNSTITTGGRLEATIHFLFGATLSRCTGVIVKTSGASAHGFWLGFSADANPPTLGIRDGGAYNGTLLASYVCPDPIGPYVELRLVWDAGYVYGYLNGVLRITVASGLYSDGLYAGVNMYGNAAGVLDFYVIGGAAPTLAVYPTVVGNYGQCSTVALTGTTTAWTPGTPGSPTFTVDHGTISAQEVLTTTTATLTYCPGDFLGTATFTDPSTGATASALVTSDPTVAPVGGTALSPTAIAYIERSAVVGGTPYIMNDTTPMTSRGASVTVTNLLMSLSANVWNEETGEGSDPGTIARIFQVWQILNGLHAPPGGEWEAPTEMPLAHSLDFLKERWEDSGHVSPWTIEQIRDALAGDPPASHQDILTAIDGIPTGEPPDLSAITDAIAAVRGDGSPDLRAVMDVIEGLRTTHNYDLTDVKGWIDALPQVQGAVSAATVVALIAALLLAVPSGGTSIAAVAVAAGAGPILDLATLVELIAVATDIASLISTVQAIQSPTPAIVPPVWPGATNAEVDSPQTLANGMTVEGPLDGLYISITGHPDGAGRYVFGDVSSWMHAGGVVFITDDDRQERAQSFGLDDQILTPLTMAHASSAVIRLSAGWTGTVSSWRINTE